MPKACQTNRWGTGTCATENKTPQSKEMNTKLQEMLAERKCQDERFLPNSDPNNKVEKVPQTNGNVLSKS